MRLFRLNCETSHRRGNLLVTNAPHLLSPFDLHGLHLKNRVVMAPLTRSRAGEERVANALMAEYYAQRASAGMIISEATTISERANGFMHTPGVYTDEQTEGWKIVTRAVHEKGTPMFLQLWHMGRAAHSDFQPHGQLPIAPSAIKIEGQKPIRTAHGKKEPEVPRALAESEIKGVVREYRDAAERAKQAGFDGVEIHSANGYLIDQFLQSKTNHREDGYGGSIEKRFRFLKEIVESILEIWPSRRIGVRLSPNGSYNDMGSPDFRETFSYVAQQLSNFQIAYLHVIDQTNFSPFHGFGEPLTLADLRKVFSGPLMGNSGYTKETAEARIADGEADLIAFGRPIIANPDLVEKFTNNWPLNPWDDVTNFYAFGAHGYTDYPTHAQSESLVKK
jgi:N-ethylmaleimide reductase